MALGKLGLSWDRELKVWRPGRPGRGPEGALFFWEGLRGEAENLKSPGGKQGAQGIEMGMVIVMALFPF